MKHKLLILAIAAFAALSPPWIGHANTGDGAELRGPGCLDGDQYRLDHHLRRSGCLSGHFDHWLGERHAQTGV